MKRRSPVIGILLGFLLAINVAHQAHAAPQAITCPDGTPAKIDLDVSAGPDAFNAAFAQACVGHMGQREEGSSDSSSGATEEASDSAETAGTWVYAGPACDNGGMCNSRQMCSDGSVKKLFYFLDAQGNRGPLVPFCPDDPGIPTEVVTPPTGGQIISAFKEVVPPKAELVVQPPGGKTLVNFRTIFSTQAEPFDSAKMELVKGFNVQFHVYPVAVNWTFGDGETLTTKDGGRMWEKGDKPEELINHIYTSKDPVKASVVVTWGADVSLNGGAPETIDATVDVTSPDVPLEILEATPQLVAPPS